MEDAPKKQRVLIVDDSPLNIMFLGKALEGDYEVISATEGQEALTIAGSKNPPGIILLDVMMPGMDGYAICLKLKDSPETKEIPVIFVTALDKDEEEEYGLSIGAIDYIKKPFSIPIVKARIKNHLELKKYRDLLKEFSMIDGLTRIANRRRFNEALSSEWNRAKRAGEPISVLIADIDFFKKYNDAYGHLEGDECLRKVAQAITDEMKRPGDLAARWGGEEFACILPETDLPGAVAVGEAVRSAVMGLSLLHETSPVMPIVTVSIGAASIIPSELDSYSALLKAADDALYHSKNTGRNKVSSI